MNWNIVYIYLMVTRQKCAVKSAPTKARTTKVRTSIARRQKRAVSLNNTAQHPQ